MAVYGSPQVTFTVDAHNEDLTDGTSVQWPSTSTGTAFPYAQIGTTPVMGLPCNPGDQILVSLNDPADTDFSTQVAAAAGQQSGTYVTYTAITAGGTDAAAETTSEKTASNEVFGPPGTNPTLTAAGTDPDAGIVVTLAFGAGLSASDTIVDAGGTGINSNGLIGAAGATDNSTRGAFLYDGTNYGYFDGPYTSVPQTVNLDESGFENIEVFATIGDVRDPHTGKYPIYMASGKSGIHGADIHSHAIGKRHKNHGNWEASVIINGSFSTVLNGNTTPGTDLVLTKNANVGSNNPEYIPDGPLPNGATSVSLATGTVISDFSTLTTGGCAWPGADPAGASGAYVLLDLSNPSTPKWLAVPSTTDLTLDAHIHHVKIGAMSTNTDAQGRYIFHPTVAGASGLSSVGYSNPLPLGDKAVKREYDYPHKPHTWQIDGAYVSFSQATQDSIQYTYFKNNTSVVEPNSGWYDTLSFIPYTDGSTTETPAIAQFTSAKNYTVTNLINLSCKAKPNYFVVANLGTGATTITNNMTADQAVVSGAPGSGTNPSSYTMNIGEVRCLYYHPSENHPDLVVLGRISKTRDTNGYLYIRGWVHNNHMNLDDQKPNSLTVEADEPKKPHKWMFDAFHLELSTANTTYSDFTTVSIVPNSPGGPLAISFVDNNHRVPVNNTSFTTQAGYYVYYNATGSAINLPVGSLAPLTPGGVAPAATIAANSMASVSQRPLDPNTGKIPKGLWTIGKLSPSPDTAGYLFIVGWHHNQVPISPSTHIPDQSVPGGQSPDGTPGKVMDGTVSVENDEQKKPHKWFFKNFHLQFAQGTTPTVTLNIYDGSATPYIQFTDQAGRLSNADLPISNRSFTTQGNYWVYYNATGSPINLPSGVTAYGGATSIGANQIISTTGRVVDGNGRTLKGLWTIGHVSPSTDPGGFLFMVGWHHNHTQVATHTIPTTGPLTTGAGGLTVGQNTITGGAGGYMAGNTIQGSAAGSGFTNFNTGTVGNNDVGDGEIDKYKDSTDKPHKWVFQNFSLIFDQAIGAAPSYQSTVHIRNDSGQGSPYTDGGGIIEIIDSGTTVNVVTSTFTTYSNYYIYFNATGAAITLPQGVATSTGTNQFPANAIDSVNVKPLGSNGKIPKGLWTIGRTSPYMDLSGYLFIRGWHHGQIQVPSHQIPVTGPLGRTAGGVTITSPIAASYLQSLDTLAGAFGALDASAHLANNVPAAQLQSLDTLAGTFGALDASAHLANQVPTGNLPSLTTQGGYGSLGTVPASLLQTLDTLAIQFGVGLDASAHLYNQVPTANLPTLNAQGGYGSLGTIPTGNMPDLGTQAANNGYLPFVYTAGQVPNSRMGWNNIIGTTLIWQGSIGIPTNNTYWQVQAQGPASYSMSITTLNSIKSAAISFQIYASSSGGSGYSAWGFPLHTLVSGHSSINYTPDANNVDNASTLYAPNNTGLIVNSVGLDPTGLYLHFKLQVVGSFDTVGGDTSSFSVYFSVWGMQ